MDVYWVEGSGGRCSRHPYGFHRQPFLVSLARRTREGRSSDVLRPHCARSAIHARAPAHSPPLVRHPSCHREDSLLQLRLRRAQRARAPPALEGSRLLRAARCREHEGRGHLLPQRPREFREAHRQAGVLLVVGWCCRREDRGDGREWGEHRRCTW
ncbi:unnamed protein product [Mycena citricolor]|uniref:Uncharacterized protein n=1 Tax=Mycena citricolor TaxID=2018698 RepID=A0AAD2HCF2_9AGAR|nr:unnamed protein product [Mycena citricolor]